MKSIDLKWIKEWTKGSPVAAMVGDEKPHFRYRRPDSSVIFVPTESSKPLSDPTSVILLANRLVWRNADDKGRDWLKLTDSDQSYVFWLRESGIWGEITEAIGHELLIAARRRFGLADDARGILFEADEALNVVPFVLITLLFGWDAYLIPRSARFLCHIDHDGFIALWAKERDFEKQLFERLAFWDARVEHGTDTFVSRPTD